MYQYTLIRTTLSYTVKIFFCYQRDNANSIISFENSLFQEYLRIKTVLYI